MRWLQGAGRAHLRTGPLLGRLSSARTREAGSTARWRPSSDFDVTVTFCFTPEHSGVEPHYTSPPKDPSEFAEFCAQMVRRYAPG